MPSLNLYPVSTASGFPNTKARGGGGEGSIESRCPYLEG